MTLTFLLGSGVSVPAHLPGTTRLTELVLDPPPLTRHTDGTYYLATPPEHSTSSLFVGRLTEFLRVLRDAVQGHYQRAGQRLTYEHLFYVARQIEDDAYGEFENPTVPAFVDTLRPRVEALLVPHHQADETVDLATLARETTGFIADLVWRCLTVPPGNTDHLRLFVEACHDQGADNINLFTMNHDTLVETYLRRSAVDLCDGFSDPMNGVRYWNPSLYDVASKVRIFKLHGSVDWFRLRPSGADWSEERIGIPLDGDPWHTKSPEGEWQTPLDGRPLLLLGTFNKITSYTTGIFQDLRARLYRALHATPALCVIGYGFGDKGINSAIIEWLYSSRRRRLIVTHGSPDELRAAARGAIRNTWDTWLRESRMVVLPRWIETLGWQDLKSALRE